MARLSTSSEPPARARIENLQSLGLDLLDGGTDAAQLPHHDDQQSNQPGDDGKSLHKVGPRIGEQAAERAVGHHHHRRNADRQWDVETGRGAHDLPERQNLRRSPEDRSRQQNDNDERLDPARIALAKEVREGDESPFPQRHGKDQADGQHGDGIPERIDPAAGEPRLIGAPGRPHDRLGAEEARVDRERDQPETQRPPRDDEIGGRLDPARDPNTDRKLHGDVAEHAPKDRTHRPLLPPVPGEQQWFQEIGQSAAVFWRPWRRVAATPPLFLPRHS